MTKNIAFLVFTMLAGTSAYATSRVAVEQAKMDSVQFDSKLHFASDSDVVAVIDYAANTVRLDVTAQVPCDGTTCLPVMPLTESIILPIVEETTECGSKVYRAMKDDTRRDGLFQEIVLQDNRTRMCRDLRPATEVTYTTEAVRSRSKTFSEFSSQEALAKPSTVESSQMTEINVDKKLINSRIGNVELLVNRSGGTVSLEITWGPCATRNNARRCMAPDRITKFEVPIIKTSTDGCGSTVIRARGHVEGAKVSLLIQDHRTRLCMDKGTGVEVRLKTEGGELPVKTDSTFSGPALQ